MVHGRSDRKENRALAHVSLVGSAGPRRTPRQERARFTVAAILEAAVAVIDEIGWAHASTNRIAERAGVSIGSLYQYFPNKETILASLVAQHREAVHVVIEQALTWLGDPDLPIERSLRQLFDELLRVHRADPALTRVLTTEVPHHPPGKDRAGSEQLATALQQALKQRPDVRVADLTAAAHVLATTTAALTRWVAHEAPPALDSDSLIHEIVTMLSGYLTGQTARSKIALD